jgi:hypothetical protein
MSRNDDVPVHSFSVVFHYKKKAQCLNDGGTQVSSCVILRILIDGGFGEIRLREGMDTLRIQLAISEEDTLIPVI